MNQPRHLQRDDRRAPRPPQSLAPRRSGALLRAIATAGLLALLAVLGSSLAVAAEEGERPAQSAKPALLSAYLGPGCKGRERVEGFEQWAGRKLDRTLDFLAVNSWREMESAASWAGKCWSDWGDRWIVSVPMLAKDGQSNLPACARGDYDEHMRTIASRLVAGGHGASIVRLGWEFNANWFPWSSVKDPKSYVACWRRWVGVMREVPDTRFRFDWTPILGVGVVSPEPAYPGDDVVDIIGADVYNVNYFPAGVPPAARWQAMRDAPFGLQWHRKFAKAHDKPMSYPEWGTGTRPDGHGGGDDPVFMAGMVHWISINRVEYHSYWDYGARDYNATLSTGKQPKSGELFQRGFGSTR